MRVGNGKTLSRDIFGACFTVVKKAYDRRRWSEGRTLNPGVLNRGDVSCRSFSPLQQDAMSWGTDLWVSALFPFPAPRGLLFTRKQLMAICGTTSAKVSC